MPFEGNRLTVGNALALCYAFGFKGGTRLVTAVCVMTAESLRYTRAYNVNDNGSVDRGLFQINDRAHPELSEDDAFDPRRNVDYAFSLYVRQGWRPWSAHNSGRYLLFWPQVFAVWALGRWRNKVSRWGD